MSGNDKNKKAQSPNQKVKVLYQNLGGQWYAFTNVGEEVYFTKVNLKNSSNSAPKPIQTVKKKTKTA